MGSSSRGYVGKPRATAIKWFRKHVLFSKSLLFICGLVVSHGLVEYALLVILITHLTADWAMILPKAAKVVNVHEGFTGVLVIFVAHLADVHVGRYPVILCCSAAYVSGLWLLWLEALRVNDNHHEISVLFLALFLISVGKAGRDVPLKAFLRDELKRNVAITGDERSESYRRFWWRISWIVGLVIGAGLSFRDAPWLQLSLISAISMVVGFSWFSLGTKFYDPVPPTSRPVFRNVLGVVRAAYLKRRLSYPTQPHAFFRNYDNLSRPFPTIPLLCWLDKAAVIESICEEEQHNGGTLNQEEQHNGGTLNQEEQQKNVEVLNQEQQKDEVRLITEQDHNGRVLSVEQQQNEGTPIKLREQQPQQQNKHNLDRPKDQSRFGLQEDQQQQNTDMLTLQRQQIESRLFTVAQVKEVKLLLMMVPMWSTFLVYSLIDATGNTFFYEQASQMYGPGVPFVVFAIIKSITSFLATFLLPKSWLEKKNILLLRIGIGMFCSIICCIIAWRAEIERLHFVDVYEDGTYFIKYINIFWLTPQFFFLGLMNGFAARGLDDFFSSQVSESMKSYGPPFSESVIGIGKFLSVCFILAFRSWFTDDINTSHLDRYYGMLSIASALNLVLYMIVTVWYCREQAPGTGEVENNELDIIAGIAEAPEGEAAHVEGAEKGVDVVEDGGEEANAVKDYVIELGREVVASIALGS